MSTQNNAASTPKINREEITQSKHGKLIITVGLQKQIRYHHEQVGGKEWCGILFYRHLEGEFDAPETLLFEGTDFYLMDIGREAYTEADMDSNSIIDKWNTVNYHYESDEDSDQKYSDFKSGLIHTHHNMNAFFSGTDMAELRESTPAHNYYLSLIVNFDGKYVAKVAFIAKREVSLKYKGTKDNEKSFIEEKEVLMMIDLDIIKEQEEVAIPDFFRSRFDSVKKQGEERAQAAASKYTTNSGNYPSGTTRFATQENHEAAWKNYNKFHDTDHESEEDTELNASKQVNKNKVNSGNGKKLSIIPPSKLELEIIEKMIEWLVDGCDIYSDMLPKGRFGSISEALQFFEKYFDNVGHDSQECKYFIQKLQRNMEVFFSYHPKTVERLGVDAMTTCAYENCSIAVDICELFEAYPVYFIEIRRSMSGKSNNKQKSHVNARNKYK